MTKGAITKLADSLTARGYLIRLTDPTDRRTQILNITQKAFDILPALAALADENSEESFGDLHQTEREMLAQLQKKIVEGYGITTRPCPQVLFSFEFAPTVVEVHPDFGPAGAGIFRG
ncbi:hypothetical protein ASD54_25565 [Rhizobium sp. Root149]|jgi:hypothetical protein|uniref:MarR family winged helix-turn-helix transcriptional regulator n=1 Tax=Rhizobium TaxID=379 RepID=UPI000713383F|nr:MULTISPECIES: MarR family winged helix-turn-helix transcriptional regulator [Rhizobium]KQZ55697.1 hypothetical protein ASD54_25565 [Rhizobium sp. Root149]